MKIKVVTAEIPVSGQNREAGAAMVAVALQSFEERVNILSEEHPSAEIRFLQSSYPSSDGISDPGSHLTAIVSW